MYICSVFKKYIFVDKSKIDYETEIIPRNNSPKFQSNLGEICEQLFFIN